MAKVSNMTEVGLVQKVFGTDGQLMVRIFDTFPSDNFKGPLFVYIDGLAVPFFIGSFGRRGTSKAIVVLDDVDTEYRASELVGQKIYVSADVAVESDNDDDQIYYEDMVGFTVVDLLTKRRGTIVEFMDYPQNPVFDVDFDGSIFPIPAGGRLIRKISVRRREIKIEIPIGIFEL